MLSADFHHQPPLWIQLYLPVFFPPLFSNFFPPLGKEKREGEGELEQCSQYRSLKGPLPLCRCKSVAGNSQLCHHCHKVHKLVCELPIVSLADSAALSVSFGWSDIYDRCLLSPLLKLSYWRAVKIYINNNGNWEVCSLQATTAILFFHLCYSKAVLHVCVLSDVSNYFQTHKFSQSFVALIFFPPVFQWWAIVSRLTGHRTVSWFSNDQVKEIYFSAPKLLLVPTCYVPFFSYVLRSCINVFRSCCSWASTPFDRNLITLNPLYSCWLFPFNILLLSIGNCWVSSHSCYLVDLT